MVEEKQAESEVGIDPENRVVSETTHKLLQHEWNETNEAQWIGTGRLRLAH